MVETDEAWDLGFHAKDSHLVNKEQMAESFKAKKRAAKCALAQIGRGKKPRI